MGCAGLSCTAYLHLHHGHVASCSCPIREQRQQVLLKQQLLVCDGCVFDAASSVGVLQGAVCLLKISLTTGYAADQHGQGIPSKAVLKETGEL